MGRARPRPYIYIYIYKSLYIYICIYIMINIYIYIAIPYWLFPVGYSLLPVDQIKHEIKPYWYNRRTRLTSPQPELKRLDWLCKISVWIAIQ